MSDLDQVAEAAARALRASSAWVEARDIGAMASRRRTVAIAAVTAVALVVLAVGLGAVFTRTNGQSSSSLLPAATQPPAGAAVQTFRPPGVGISIQIPATWTAQPPPNTSVGYEMRGPGSQGFIGLAHRASVPMSVASYRDEQVKRLQAFGGVLHRSRIGKVDGHPAVKLTYFVQGKGLSAEDTEYDILLGAGQVAVVVVGTSPTQPNLPLVNWISSTIKVQP
jgi:hypothetical protein